MAYNEAFVAVFNGIYGAGKCSPYNGAYLWNGEAPSAPIIAAVEALPVAEAEPVGNNRLYSLASDDALMTALQALVSGTQWTNFLTWKTGRYAEACNVVVKNHACCEWEKTKAQCLGQGYQGVVDLLRPALTAAGLDAPI